MYSTGSRLDMYALCMSVARRKVSWKNVWLAGPILAIWTICMKIRFAITKIIIPWLGWQRHQIIFHPDHLLISFSHDDECCHCLCLTTRSRPLIPLLRRQRHRRARHISPGSSRGHGYTPAHRQHCTRHASCNREKKLQWRVYTHYASCNQGKNKLQTMTRLRSGTPPALHLLRLL